MLSSMNFWNKVPVASAHHHAGAGRLRSILPQAPQLAAGGPSGLLFMPLGASSSLQRPRARREFSLASSTARTSTSWLKHWPRLSEGKERAGVCCFRAGSEQGLQSTSVKPQRALRLWPPSPPRRHGLSNPCIPRGLRNRRPLSAPQPLQEPDVELDPRTPGSRPEPKADA